MIKIVRGDLLTAKQWYVAHQCNCVSRQAAGLAAQIFAKWPQANAYDPQICPAWERRPGNVWISSGRPVAALFAQHRPGQARTTYDDWVKRLGWFRESLGKLLKLGRPVALPHGIGCGLAGGRWSDYQEALEEASRLYGVPIFLYQLPGRP